MKNGTEFQPVPDVGQLIDRLHEISKLLLRAAQDQQWDDVEALNQQRNELLMILSQSNDIDKAAIQDDVNAILELDQQILALTNTAMNDVADQVSAATTKAKISREYRSVQTIG